MNSKKWIKLFTIYIILGYMIIGSINCIVDPMWLFSHSNKLNSLQHGFNERLQKSANLRYNTNLAEIDTLLLGASTTTYYDHNMFGDLRVYNYSVSSMEPYEYKQMVEFAKKLKRENFDNIILGLDFVFYKNYGGEKKLEYLENFEENKVFFIFSNYFSLDMLTYSIKNIVYSLLGRTGHRAYTRENVVLVNKISSEEVGQIVENNKKDFFEGIQKNKDYSKAFRNLKESNEDSKFIVYTTPLAEPFLDEIYSNENLKENYINWIKEIVSIFGKVYFFTVKNEYSKNYLKSSKDGVHFYPEVGRNVANIIVSDKMSSNYGIVINKVNLEEKLKLIERNFNEK